jgi:DNA-binding transcriptional ArsR family regulator
MIALDRTNDMIDNHNDKPEWTPKYSEAVKRVIEVLKVHPEGLTVRQIALAIGISVRHAYRIMKVLRANGVVKKLYELRKEKVIDTRLRHYETVEIAHRYVLTGPETLS